MDDKILEKDIEKNQYDLIDDDPFASYDIPFDYKFPEDERLNKIYNIEDPYDYVNMEEFMDKLNEDISEVDLQQSGE